MSTPEHIADLERRMIEFQRPEVAAGYRFRPIYPDSVFSRLASSIPATNRTVLDVGCGTGNVARLLVPYADRIDAVDPSSAMIETGKALPGGDNPAIHWMTATIEDAPLTGPYGLIACGLSLHFLDTDRALPLFQRLLAPGSVLAVLSVSPDPSPWDDALEAIRNGVTSTAPKEDRVHFEALERAGLITNTGGYESDPEPWPQTVDDFIMNLKSRSTWANHLTNADTLGRVRDLLCTYTVDGTLPMTIRGRLWWGVPAAQVS